MDQLIKLGMIAGILLVAMITIGIIFARLYRRSSKEISFVRTGLGGQKVVMGGGAIILPIFHECVNINMKTIQLEISLAEADSLITLDRLRVDALATFFVRVIPSIEGVANAAQTLGQRTMHPNQLDELVDYKFVDALRTAAVSMEMHQLFDKRADFIQAVQNAVSEDLLKNGLQLESVSLTRLDQTPVKYYDPHNAFDAEGLTKITQQTQRRAQERNEIEQDTTMAIAKKNYEANQLKLNLEQDQVFATLRQKQEIATREAAVKQMQIEAEQNVKIAQIEQDRSTALADQDKLIAIAEKSKAQSEVEKQANEVRALAVYAEEKVKTSREVAAAERDKQIALVAAEKLAQERAISVRVAAEAERDAAQNHAEAVKIRAEAQEVQYQVDAKGIDIRNAALNTLSAEQIAMQIKMKLLDALPAIIEASVKPIEKIDSIKIVQVNGLNRSPAGGGTVGTEAPNGVSDNLVEQAVSAALSYRVQQPIVDAVLNEIGMKGGNLQGLVESVRKEI